MKRYIRKFIKEEKRIVKLCYQKGLLDDWKLTALYWNEYREGNKGRRRNCDYKFSDRLPELHFSSIDYFGECDEHSVVDAILDGLFWKHSYTDGVDEYNMPDIKSTFRYGGRLPFISYLKALPTKKRDSKVNSILRRNKED